MCAPPASCPRAPSPMPPPMWPAPTSTSCGSTEPRSTRARASVSRTSSTTRPPTSPTWSARGRPMPSASCTTGTGRAGAGPPRRRASSSRRWSTTTTATSSPSDPTGGGGPSAPNGCLLHSATTTLAISSSGSTAGSPLSVGRSPDSTTEDGHRRRCWGRWAASRSPTCTPNGRGSASTRYPRCRSGRCPRDRWSSTSARSTPGGPWCPSGAGPTAIRSPCMSAIPSIRTGRCRPRTTPRAPTSPSSTSSGPGVRPSFPTGTSGSGTSRSTTRVRPSTPTRCPWPRATPPCPTARWLRSSPPTRRSMPCGRCARTRPSTPLRSSSSTRRPGRKVNSSGMPPTSPRR